MEQGTGGKRSGSIQVLQRAAVILEAVSQSQTAMSGAALARVVGLNKSTAFNILSTLVDLGFLTVTPESRYYRLGPRMYHLSDAFQSSYRLTAVAGPSLYALRDETQESVSLHVRSGWDRVCIDQAQSLQSIVRVLELGRRRPLYVGAAGLVLLAGMDAERLDAYLERTSLDPLTQRTVTDADALRRNVAEAARRGYAEAHEEADLGVSAVALPVRDGEGCVDAALVVSGPAGRFDPDVVQRLRGAAQRTVIEIEIERSRASGGGEGDELGQ